MVFWYLWTFLFQLKIDSSRYFENVIMILQYIARENLKNLNQVIDKTK